MGGITRKKYEVRKQYRGDLMRSKRILLIVLIVLSLQTGCLYAVRYDGPYKGRVVDKDTREPIEGAVVLGTWAVYHFGLAGGYSTFYDAKEAVTDKKGAFMMPGQGLRILSSLGPMGYLIYKAGHDYYETDWDYLMKQRNVDDEIKWEGELPVFPLKKLTEEERKKDLNGSLIPGALHRKTLMTREINKERLYRGYTPFGGDNE
jgi:hypothetical protein